MSSESKNEIRQEFSARLKRALKDAGIKSNSPTELQRFFNANNKGDEVTVHACRKWLVSEAMPTREKMRALARALAVPEDWLWFGGDLGRSAEDQDISHEERRMLTLWRDLDEDNQDLARTFMTMLGRRQKKKMAPFDAIVKRSKLAA